MASRPRFSEVLFERRRELGLSIAQASRVLKLRADVLVAFEEGDFEHLPQSGYAKGMLSSYARYLGLNPREVTDLFEGELYQFKNGVASHELRRRSRQSQAGRGASGHDASVEAGSRQHASVEYRTLLPASGGPAGDMGYYATTSPVMPSSPVPLASSEAYAARRQRYLAEPSQDERDVTAAGGRPRYNQPSRDRSQGSAARRRAAGRRGRTRSGAEGAPEGRGDFRRDDVSTRRVRPNEYTDDMRLDESASPYALASTISGRRSSRNIANAKRPNVRRRRPSSSSGGRGGRRSSSGGVLGVIEGFFSDSRRAVMTIVLLAALILATILVLAVGSCVSGSSSSSSGSGQTVAVNSATSSDADEGEDETEDAEDTTVEDATAATTDDSSEETTDADDTTDSEETVVTVSVASGAYSWVEILCDDVSEVAEGITGPWSATYTVTDSITVQVTDSSVVTVTNNGETVDFSSNAGGVESLTIKAATTDTTTS